MRSVVQWVFRVVAVFVFMLTLVQPVLGSFAFFRSGDLIDYEIIHTVAGSLVYYLTMLLAGLAFFTWFPRRWTILACCISLVVATHVQLLLGIESNDDAGLLAYHIPVGVAIILFAFLTVTLSFGMRFHPD